MFTPDFSVITTGGAKGYAQGVYYQGMVNGNQKSLAAISIFENEVMGVLDEEGSGNFILGAFDKDRNGRYAFFKSDDLKQDLKMDCEALEAPKQQTGGQYMHRHQK